MIGQGFANHETGALYGPGLIAHGLPLSRLVFVEAPNADAAFWAMEEALKSGGPAAVVGEIWNLKGYSLAASRRLLLAARKGQDPGAPGPGQRLRPGGADVQRRRDAVRDRRRAERQDSGRGWPGPARPLRLRGAARQGAPDLRARWAAGGGRRGPHHAVSNGEARIWLFMRTWLSTRTWLLTTRRFLSLWLPRLATDRARRLNRVDKATPLAAVARINNAERLVGVDAEAARLGLSPDFRLRMRARACPSSSPSRRSLRKRRG